MHGSMYLHGLRDQVELVDINGLVDINELLGMDGLGKKQAELQQIQAERQAELQNQAEFQRKRNCKIIKSDKISAIFVRPAWLELHELGNGLVEPVIKARDKPNPPRTPTPASNQSPVGQGEQRPPAALGGTLLPTGQTDSPPNN